MTHLNDTDQAPYSAHTATVSDAAVQVACEVIRAHNTEQWGEDGGNEMYCELVTNMLTAALPHLALSSAPCSVEVERLTWREPCRDNNMCWTAKSIFGTFSVAFDDGWHAGCYDGINWEWEPENDPRSYRDEYAAQQACQDWHDRRILSQIATKLVDLAAVWNDAVEQSAVIADSCHMLTPDVGNAVRNLKKRALFPAEPAQGEQWQPTHRHVKRGTEYRKIGNAQIQCEDGLTDYEVATVYIGMDGNLWVRRVSEFEDGRFITLSAGRTTEGGEV